MMNEPEPTRAPPRDTARASGGISPGSTVALGASVAVLLIVLGVGSFYGFRALFRWQRGMIAESMKRTMRYHMGDVRSRQLKYFTSHKEYAETVELLDADTPGSHTEIFGFHFIVLDKQGSHAPGGAKSFRDSKGVLKLDYAVLALPDDKLNGKDNPMRIDTAYMLGSDGKIYSKKYTAEMENLKTFDPDESWTEDKE